MDTIFAVSSGQPPAAIAVLRISGAAAQSTVKQIAGTLPPSRRAGLRTLRDPATGGVLDQALVLFFPGPATATGEDLVELHLHGGRAVIVAVQDVLRGMPDLRAAEPGEFTRRALIHGRIDLTEAEGLGDLLQAETQAQRRAALQASDGDLRRQVDAWSAALLGVSAQIEALIDFSDEGDVEGSTLEPIRGHILRLAAEIDTALSQPPVERLRDGLRVVIAGPPNAGKSTLLNALTGRTAAIVSDVPGTTRDRIEIPVTRNGIAWVFIDTAGLRQATDDAIERVGIGLAENAIREADLVLWLGDDPPPGDALWVQPRCDEVGRDQRLTGQSVLVAAKDGTGLSELWVALDHRAASLLPTLDRPLLNRRQRDLLAETASAILAAASTKDALLIAEDLRAARLALDRLTGRVDVEGVLDALFGRFCIGK